MRADGTLHLGPEDVGRYAVAGPGDIAFTKQGHVAGWVLKKVGLVPNHLARLHVATTLQVVRPRKELVTSAWLLGWLSRPATYELVQAMLGGRHGLTASVFRSIPVPLPPLREQQERSCVLEYLL